MLYQIESGNLLIRSSLFFALIASNSPRLSPFSPIDKWAYARYTYYSHRKGEYYAARFKMPPRLFRTVLPGLFRQRPGGTCYLVRGGTGIPPPCRPGGDGAGYSRVAHGYLQGHLPAHPVFRPAKNGPGPDHGQNDFNQRGKLCGQRLLLRRRPAALPPLPLCLVPRLRRRERT